MIKLENNNVFIPPMPVALVGTRVEGKANFLAVGWITRVNLQPPMLAIGLSKRHHTVKGILENKAFSVCFPGSDMEEITDYCGVVSGREVDKSGLFELFYGEGESAPMIAACPLNIECRLHQTVELPSHLLFIGEIVGVYSEEHFLTNGRPDIKKIDPLLLTMPDNCYWKVGEQAGKAFSDGLARKKRMENAQ